MDVNGIIESYVRDVAACLPRDRRDDVAFELRALLDEELAARAVDSGRAPDRAMAMALLAGFGRPPEVAQRYHASAPLVAAADTHHFLIWATGGAAVLVMHALLNPGSIEVDALFLQWLGLLLLAFAGIGWMRRRRPDAFGWKPSHGPEWMPRPLAALALVAFVIFPVAMYAAPVAFARVLLPDAVPVDGLTLTPAFAASWQRALTLALLIGMALQHATTLVLGRQPAWLRRIDVALNLALGVALVAHASPMTPLDGGPAFPVFGSAHANAVASPIFLAVGGIMVLIALYYAYRAWANIRPAPMPARPGGARSSTVGR